MMIDQIVVLVVVNVATATRRLSRVQEVFQLFVAKERFDYVQVMQNERFGLVAERFARQRVEEKVGRVVQVLEQLGYAFDEIDFGQHFLVHRYVVDHVTRVGRVHAHLASTSFNADKVVFDVVIDIDAVHQYASASADASNHHRLSIVVRTIETCLLY